MITKKVFLRIPKSQGEIPIIYYLVKELDLVVKIIRARITPEEEGFMLVDLKGDEERIKKGEEYLLDHSINVSVSERGLHRSEESCVHCGNCVSHCPTHALHINDRKTMIVDLDLDKCIECMNCIKNCPFGACSSSF